MDNDKMGVDTDNRARDLMRRFPGRAHVEALRRSSEAMARDDIATAAEWARIAADCAGAEWRPSVSEPAA